MDSRDVLGRAGGRVVNDNVESREQTVFPVRESRDGYGGCRGAGPNLFLYGRGGFGCSIESGVRGRLEDAEVANHRGWGVLREIEVELGGVCFDAEARGLGDCEGDVATDQCDEDCSQMGEDLRERHTIRFGLVWFWWIELSEHEEGGYKYGLSKKSTMFG
jgi:hypothetical protein